MKLKTVMTSKNVTLNQPAPRQVETGHGGLPVRTNLRAGNLLIGTDSNGAMPTGHPVGHVHTHDVEA
ncbi:MAG: hypothetical protein KBG20_00165 [Caldilineaceae bacterium]|nr:hypothetical protein [Caldilineaceae bacterium]MBP8107236.1 hypothetical protein [Caldilineaceae bacterium]MBP8121366.1 hypothetical protein [Caldilineaceae bacterium]MBP9070671.1 hypothetical protein [Caldilineaceae bacterium]